MTLTKSSNLSISLSVSPAASVTPSITSDVKSSVSSSVTTSICHNSGASASLAEYFSLEVNHCQIPCLNDRDDFPATGQADSSCVYNGNVSNSAQPAPHAGVSETSLSSPSSDLPSFMCYILDAHSAMISSGVPNFSGCRIPLPSTFIYGWPLGFEPQVLVTVQMVYSTALSGTTNQLLRIHQSLIGLLP